MSNIKENVSINEFVYRQTKNSGKTYLENFSFIELASHAEKQLNDKKFTNGYRDGVILVNAATEILHHFICPFVKISKNTKLIATQVRRRPEEEYYIQIRAKNGKPLITGAVELILYRHDVLAETNEQSTNSDWELISFHAIPKGLNHMPMGPITMMRNQLQLIGGTKGTYKSEDWARSIHFWQKYAILDNN